MDGLFCGHCAGSLHFLGKSKVPPLANDTSQTSRDEKHREIEDEIESTSNSHLPDLQFGSIDRWLGRWLGKLT